MLIKKSHKSYLKTIAKTRSNLKFGTLGFKIMSSFRLTLNQLEYLDRALKQKLKSLMGSSKNYKYWLLIQTNKNLTKQSLESRMGKGKGSIWTKSVFLKAGSIIYEFSNIKSQQVYELYSFLKKKVPYTKLVLVKNFQKERET